MNDNPLGLISFLISTFLSFFSAAFVVEVAIALFRIKKHRLRSILRLVPLISIGSDFFLSKLSTGNLLNPLHCESCVQKLFLYFMPELKSYLTEHQIAWSRHLASQVPHSLFSIFVLVFSSLSAVIFLRKIILILFFNRDLYRWIKRAVVCSRAIESEHLSKALQSQEAKILVSEDVESPMAVYSRTILIPKNLVEQLPQDEFEAVLSHELEHLRWKDPILKLICQIGSTLFWWVPTRWWFKRVEQDQEMAADASVQRYHLNETALASALVKIAREYRSKLICAFAAGKNSVLLLRLKIALDPSATAFQNNLLRRACIGVAAGFLILISCMM